MFCFDSAITGIVFLDLNTAEALKKKTLEVSRCETQSFSTQFFQVELFFIFQTQN
jgi:hypothetical protein